MFESGPFIDVVKSLLDPSPIYSAMSYYSGLSFLILFLFPLFVAIRLATEASHIGVKSSVGEAFSDFASTPVRFMIYSVFGFVMFQLLFHIQSLFENLGSAASIEISLAEFKGKMMVSPEQNEDWILSVLKLAADVGNGLTMPIFFVLYEIISCLYILIKHLMMVVFALLVVLTYAYGFVAILTQSLPKIFNLTSGFIRSFLALAIWSILEPIALGLINILQQPGQEALIRIYAGGIGSTAMNVWCLYCCILLTISALVLIVIPMIAHKLAQNEGMVGSMAAGAGALSGVLFNAALNRASEVSKKSASSALGGMMPDTEGTRRRDGLFQQASDRASSILGSDLVTGARNFMGRGLGDSTTTLADSPVGNYESNTSSAESSSFSSQNESADSHAESNNGSHSSTDSMAHSTNQVSSELGNNITEDHQTSASDIYSSSQHDYGSMDTRQFQPTDQDHSSFTAEERAGISPLDNNSNTESNPQNRTAVSADQKLDSATSENSTTEKENISRDSNRSKTKQLTSTEGRSNKSRLDSGIGDLTDNINKNDTDDDNRRS